MADLIADAVRNYLEALVPPRPAEMQRMEAYAAEHGFPIIGPAAGAFCYLITRIARAQRVFEMGSGYGYSTAWFARAVRDNGGGVVHHVVWDAGLSSRARRHLDALGLGDLVTYHVGEAIEVLRGCGETFDLVFNDIEKHAYPAAVEVIEDTLRPGGILIADNVLWHGRIFDRNDRSRDTEGIREFTRRLTTSPGWICAIVPIRDGLLVAQRVTGAW